MDVLKIQSLTARLAGFDYRNLYLDDFLLTWEKSDDEIQATFLVAEILRGLRQRNISSRIFDSGLGISLFRDQSTRTRFSFASACNLLGLEVQDLDEGKSQVAHGETVRETANMVSFMADVIGIRDDMYIGKGNAYMREVAEAVQQGYREGVLEQRPTLVNLQCDIDHPTQSMADMLHLINTFGGVDKLKGKKIAMTWAYSPSYGKPLSVPQGVIGLMTRFGMDVVLAHPEGLRGDAGGGGRGQTQCGPAAAAVYQDRLPWRRRSRARISSTPKAGRLSPPWKSGPTCTARGTSTASRPWKRSCWPRTPAHKDWECTEKLMADTHQGNALYMHCLPADITGVSCEEGRGGSQRVRPLSGARCTRRPATSRISLRP